MPDLTSRNLEVDRTGPVVTVSFPRFNKTGLVRGFFSTRRGGVSEGPYSAMNLSFSRGDKPSHVYENYRRICYVWGIYPGDIVCSEQVHGDRILEVTQANRGEGLMRASPLSSVDGLITNKRQVCLTTFHADCAAIFLLDPVHKAIGLSHAGWRGTVRHIASKTVRAMQETYGSDPKEMLAGISPCIGPCCFQVRQDVYRLFCESYTPVQMKKILNRQTGEDSFFLDLPRANRFDLMEAGLTASRIAVTDLCTCCEEDYFFSHRRMGQTHGSMAAFLELI